MIRHIALLSLMLPCAAASAAQEVRACRQSDGSVVYTDGLCTVEQSEKPQEPTAGTGNGVSEMRTPRHGLPPPPTCSRTPAELQWAIRAALDARDVNDLAKSYHWTGTTNAQAEAVMVRLEQLTRMPALDVRLLYAEDEEEQQEHVQDAETAASTGPRARLPSALKVVSMLDDGAERTRSTPFRLQRHFACWWIRF